MIQICTTKAYFAIQINQKVSYQEKVSRLYKCFKIQQSLQISKFNNEQLYARHNKPVQLNPSPVNPSWHIQMYDPLASMQVALSWQPSSTSQLMISTNTDFNNLSIRKTYFVYLWIVVSYPLPEFPEGLGIGRVKGHIWPKTK